MECRPSIEAREDGRKVLADRDALKEIVWPHHAREFRVTARLNLWSCQLCRGRTPCGRAETNVCLLAWSCHAHLRATI